MLRCDFWSWLEKGRQDAIVLWPGEPNHGHQADVSCASSSVTEGCTRVAQMVRGGP